MQIIHVLEADYTRFLLVSVQSFETRAVSDRKNSEYIYSDFSYSTKFSLFTLILFTKILKIGILFRENEWLIFEKSVFSIEMIKKKNFSKLQILFRKRPTFLEGKRKWLPLIYHNNKLEQSRIHIVYFSTICKN